MMATLVFNELTKRRRDPVKLPVIRLTILALLNLPGE